MSTYKLTAERSFELIRVVSMNTNRKVRDVAAGIVLTGSLDLQPAPGSGQDLARPDLPSSPGLEGPNPVS
jgi:hypothetical protein